MKTKISKKLISICLSLLICISVLPLSMISADAAGYSLEINNVIYPRPGATPSGNVSLNGNFSCELLGWCWTDNDGNMAAGPDSFKNFMSSVMVLFGEDADVQLTEFTDTVEYNLLHMIVVKNSSIPDGTECEVSYYDRYGEFLNFDGSGFFMSASTIMAQMPSGVSLPDGVTSSDTLLMCSAEGIVCSPTDHTHLTGNYATDANKHWLVCSICGKKMAGTEYEHYSYSGRTENWTEVKKATATQEGIYEKRCSRCSYAMESVTVPKTGEQTVVTTYEELRNALAKGGKQWITLDFKNKILKQQDFNRNYTLCVDDSNADITIDLNDCILIRTTMYDSHLFDVKQGSLRIWQKDGDNILGSEHQIGNNMNFECAEAVSAFNVEKEGSLRLTNVHALTPNTSFGYSFPNITSKGNLRIDSGCYKNYNYNEQYDDTVPEAVVVSAGTVEINGGEFYSYFSNALKVTGEADSATTVEINGGDFGSRGQIAVSLGKNTVATVNDGDFDSKDTVRNFYQNYGLYSSGSELTINGGYFYGSVCAVDAIYVDSLKVTDGYFRLYDETPEENEAALAISTNKKRTVNLSGGTYRGTKGIAFYAYPYEVAEGDFSKVIPSACRVNDYDNGYVVDHNITAHSLGAVEISAKKPVITLQPSGGHSDVMGDAIVLKIDGENVDEYVWHVIDENGKELSWNYLSNNGYATLNARDNGKILFISNVSDWMTGKRVYCIAKGYGGEVMSDIVDLSVEKVIKYCYDMYFDDFDQIWNHKTVGDFKNPKTDTNAPYTISEVKWTIYKKLLGDSYEFGSGDNVVVAITVEPKDGYTFYSSVYGMLNGIESSSTITNSDGSRTFGFEVKITAPDEYKTQNIELSVEAPVAGKKPATTAKCISGYAVTGKPTWTPADATFKSGKQYKVRIPVTPEYDWGETSTVTAKINGKDAEFIIESVTPKIRAYYVEYTFDATSDYALGDVNCDGAVTLIDAITIQKAALNLTTLTGQAFINADMNSDKKINLIDAITAQKTAMHIS